MNEEELQKWREEHNKKVDQERRTLGKWALGIGAVIIVVILIYSGINDSSSSNLTKVRTQEPQCHPSYSGCLKPDASDYDCVGGSGNGPYYTGTVRVIGPDVFGLDRDGDGWGCE